MGVVTTEATGDATGAEIWSELIADPKEELRECLPATSPNERVPRTHPKSNSCVHGRLPAGAPTGAPGRDTLQMGLF